MIAIAIARAWAWVKTHSAWITVAIVVALAFALDAIFFSNTSAQLERAKGESDVKAERARAKTREAEVLGGRRTELETRDAEIVEEIANEHAGVQGSDMSTLAERFNRRKRERQ